MSTIKTTSEMACEVCKAFPPHGGGMWYQGVSKGPAKWVCVDEHACASAYTANYQTRRRSR